MKIRMACAAVALAAMSLFGSETEIVNGVTWYYETYQRNYRTEARIVKGGDLYSGDLVVPTSLGGYPVTWIGSSAFEGCSGLTSIILPEGLVTLGSSAFRNCQALTEIVIPDSVQLNSGYVFSGCTRLRSAKLPASSAVIPYEMFYGCSALTSVILPTNLTSISNYAFYDCAALREVALPASVTTIGDYAFYGCTVLKDVELPSGIETIGWYAFVDCKALTRMALPASVTLVGEQFICGCDNLKTITVASGNPSYKVVNNCLVTLSGTTLIAVPFGCARVDIPAGVLSVPGAMFSQDNNLTTVTIPSGVTTIGDYAFCQCRNLTGVDIPVGVTSIGTYAFEYCGELAHLTLPEGLTQIGYGAFYWAYSLAEIVLPSTVTSLGSSSFSGLSRFRVVFKGAPPSGIQDSGLLGATTKSFPREYGAAWQKLMGGIGSFTGFGQPNRPVVTIVSSQIRENDPTVMDVVYKVTSAKSTVKVRALAFQDGERSFAKVVRPETFIDGTAVNLGDAITANVEHRLSWKVSNDWATDLSRVKFEVLAVEENLLPFELVTIPASESYGAMQVSWNVIAESQYLDALFWLYADNTPDLSLTGGSLMANGKELANGASLSHPYWGDYPAPGYVFGKMGFEVLEGAKLEYVKEETRYDLNPEGFRQYAVKMLQ